MKSMMQAFYDKQIKWSQWSPTEGMVRCGFASYKELMQWIRDLGKEAKQAVRFSNKNHAVYAIKFHDYQGIITEIRLFCDTYVDDQELKAMSAGNLNTIYAAHKN